MSVRTRVVVVGAGMVGARFVEELRDRDQRQVFDITLLGAEEYQPYNRVLLSDLVAGKVSAASLELPALDRPDRRAMRIRHGASVCRLDRVARVVRTGEGQGYPYDVLVLATGARARIPDLAGLEVDAYAGSARSVLTARLPAHSLPPARSLPPGVHVLRTLDDAREIVAATLNAQRAIVVGGGVLGVEAAVGLAGRGLPTTLLHPAPALMERQLDPAASDVLAARLAVAGVSTRVGAATVGVVPDSGRVVGVRLEDGTVVAGDLVVLCCGTLAETGLAADAGLPVGRGILVGEDLASPADPHVFAIGDCAQPPEGGTGLVAQGWDQARRLAAHLVGRAAASRGAAAFVASGASGATVDHDPPEGTDVVRVKGTGIDLVTLGQTACHAHAPEDRVVRLSDPGGHRLVEVVVRDERIVGATCIGAGQVAVDLTVAYRRGTPVPADPAHLLLRPVGPAEPSASPTNMPNSTTVCRCNGVTKGAIVACYQQGARSVSEVATATRATTGCGGCSEVVAGLVDWLRTTDPDAAPGAVSREASGSREQAVPSPKPGPHEVETPAA